jgi:hypothetical protein
LDFASAYWIDQEMTDDTNEDSDVFGQALAAGDFNDDGIGDLLVGAPGENTTEGALYLFSGASGGLANGTRFDQGDTITTPEFGDFFGLALAAGDLNEDGVDDFVVGAPGEAVSSNTLNDAGTIHVFHGSASGPPVEAASLSESSSGCGPNGALHQFGGAVAIGTLDGAAGGDDLVIGIPGRLSDTGAMCVMPGSSTGITPTLTGSYSASSYGAGTEVPGDRFGASLSIGRLDADGIDDVVVGVPVAAADEGRVHVLFGRDMGTATTAFSGAIRIDQAAAGQANAAGERFGDAVAAGDVDGDGIDELAVGAPGETLGPEIGSGAVSVFDGAASGPATGSTFVRGADVPGIGNLAGAGFGAPVVFGDFDGDGDEDLVVASPGHGNAAGAFAYFRSDGASLTAIGAYTEASAGGSADANDRFTDSLAVGDFDGDGRVDLAVGVPGESDSGFDSAGSVMIIPGCVP